MTTRTSERRRRAGFSLVELVVVLGISSVVLAIAVPAMAPAVGGYRLNSVAHDVTYQLSVAKLRAASAFTRARLYCDLSARTYRIEIWNRTGTPGWVTEGGTQTLAGAVGFSYANASTPPPNTQGSVAFAAGCRDNSNDLIANTSCVTFNSRGIPIDSTGAPVGGSALYVSDGSAVYAATVSATGLTQLWWTPTRTLAWQKQ
jgi:prepilin-type N-terminal cleavage/methylation domain-containing protein